MGLLCVSIDLDEVHCYHGIHGLEAPAGPVAEAIHRSALPRALRFLDDVGVAGTLFAVGRDAALRPATGELLRAAAGRGHEIANHSLNHRYDLGLLSADEQAREIRGGADAIQQIVGVRPAGFRAPGYNVHLGLLDVVADQGATYDSSVFPCPSYFAARALAIGLKQARGRVSASQLGDPRVLLAPQQPYRLGRDGVWSRGEGLVELPISVVGPARLPFIGTTLVLAGKVLAGILARQASSMGFVNLELHGIDFADAEADGLEHLKRFQPDLRLSARRKIAILERVVKTLLDRGMQPVTLLEAAGRAIV
ncbi:MAG TPA: polysaccharide deacetylase family protein [Polyangia bacterium]|nr:polysaccharide deacetylase family protein [Polyangia bacterium]